VQLYHLICTRSTYARRTTFLRFNYSLAHSQIETNLLFDRADVLTSVGGWATLIVLFAFAIFIFIKSRAK